MGHVDLAAPVSHIWFFKGVPSRIGYLLDMAPKELEKVSTSRRRSSPGSTTRRAQKDLGKLEKEIDKTIQSYEAEREERVMELQEAVDRRVKYLETGDQKGFSDDDLLWADTLDVNLKKLSDDERGKMEKDLRKQFDADISDTEAYYEDGIERLRQTWELFQTMEPKQVIADETLFRELKDRFGSPFGWGEYFRGGMGAESVRDLLQQVDLDAEREELEDRVKTAKGQKQSRAVKRLKVVSAFIHSDNKPEDMILEAVPVIPPELRPMVQLDGGRFRDLGPERPLPPRHQPEQPAEAAARPRRARDHRQQREADAAGGRRRAVRQRPPQPDPSPGRATARSSRSATC